MQRARLNIFRLYQFEVAPANDAEPQRRANGCTSVHSAEKTPTHHAAMGFKQAMASLYIASQFIELQETINYSTKIDLNHGYESLILAKRSTEQLREGRVQAAAIARPVSQEEDVIIIKGKSVAIVDCGHSSTLTRSLINATDIEENVAIIETADGEERTKAAYKCNKTYFGRNRMGDPVPTSVPALFIRGLHHDLLVVKLSTK